ncbi:hypothetical protein B0H13DRAFT_1889304 [Mycena leptocephala]|nr:hypothetical protein B0H13DRAFT_1889304 [Mycena leptocephala]
MSHLPAATSALPNARQELRALIATVDKLFSRSLATAHTAEAIKAKLSDITDSLDEEAPPPDPVFVRDVAKTPGQVEAENAHIPNGTRPWWVVFVGREPGIYSTVEAADLQIKGCPGQEYRRKGSKAEALSYYRMQYDGNLVKKWVEVVDDDE